MKKVFLNLIVVGLLLGGVFQQAQAQDKTLEFNLNIGALTDTSFEDALFTLGAGLDFHLGKLIMISPELQLWSYKFRFDAFLLNPGVILNFKMKNFFAGGGVILPFFISGDEDIESGELMPKINAGLRTNRIKIAVYMITTFHDLFDYILLGANVGIVF
jgi:hypothetical protein